MAKQHQLKAQVAHFRVRRPIGVGAMAEVYEAEDTRSGTVVALKLLAEHVNATSEAVARFVREGRALQSLRHTNIVRVLDQGITDEGDAWIALERLYGGSLDALIREEGQLHPTRALRIMHSIAKALAMVHARGLIHRDIKSENIFIVSPGAPQEHAKLIDFGIARMTKAQLGENSVIYTRMNTMMGTAAFAAPEQMLGTSLGPTADVFSLGVTAYEMLTGALPFEGQTIKEQLESKTVGRIVPITSRLQNTAELSPAFGAVIMSCLAVDPKNRPKDGAALMEQLALCYGEASSRPSFPSQEPPPQSFRSWFIGLGVAALVASAIATWILLRH